MNYFFGILLQIVLIFLNAIFACAEIAVISMGEAKLNALSAKGNRAAKKAKKLKKLTADPARFLSTIQVAITLSGFLGSAFAADMFAEPLVGAIMKTGIGIPHSVVSAFCVVLITLILAFFNIVLGELVPKRIAMKHAEGVSTKLTGILGFVSVVFKPIVFLLSISTNLVLKIFGISPDDPGETVTEEDIIMMTESGEESGNIESSESELIKNIFEFSDLTIGEICTHRKDVDILYSDDDVAEWEKIINSTEHSYYPLCGNNSDDILGVLRTKTYFRLQDKSRENILANAVNPAVFFYENVAANTVFDKMKKTHNYFAVVVDEYGGMAGIVSIHDILECIVGDMTDADEEEDYKIEKKEDNLWEITGVIPLDKVEEELEVELDGEENSSVTFNGYVLNALETFPDEDKETTVENELVRVRVMKIEQQCITKMQVSLVNPDRDEDEDDDDDRKRDKKDKDRDDD